MECCYLFVYYLFVYYLLLLCDLLVVLYIASLCLYGIYITKYIILNYQLCYNTGLLSFNIHCQRVHTP